MTRVHQFHPVLAPGDAMSNHVFALQRRLRDWGYEAHAYAIEAKAGADEVLPYRRLFRDVSPDDLVLVHFSMGNEVFTQLAKLRARKVLVYHNITPAEFFRGINAHAASRFLRVLSCPPEGAPGGVGPDGRMASDSRP